MCGGTSGAVRRRTSRQRTTAAAEQSRQAAAAIRVADDGGRGAPEGRFGKVELGRFAGRPSLERSTPRKRSQRAVQRFGADRVVGP